jgi:hypothetical protein
MQTVLFIIPFPKVCTPNDSQLNRMLLQLLQHKHKSTKQHTATIIVPAYPEYTLVACIVMETFALSSARTAFVDLEAMQSNYTLLDVSASQLVVSGSLLDDAVAHAEAFRNALAHALAEQEAWSVALDNCLLALQSPETIAAWHVIMERDEFLLIEDVLATVQQQQQQPQKEVMKIDYATGAALMLDVGLKGFPRQLRRAFTHLAHALVECETAVVVALARRNQTQTVLVQTAASLLQIKRKLALRACELEPPAVACEFLRVYGRAPDDSVTWDQHVSALASAALQRIVRVVWSDGDPFYDEEEAASTERDCVLVLREIVSWGRTLVCSNDGHCPLRLAAQLGARHARDALLPIRDAACVHVANSCELEFQTPTGWG